MVAILFRLQHVRWLLYSNYKHNGLVNTATTVQDVYQLSARLDNSLDLIATLNNIFWTEMCFLTLMVGTRLRISGWISNHKPSKVWDEITHPFLNFNGCTVEV